MWKQRSRTRENEREREKDGISMTSEQQTLSKNRAVGMGVFAAAAVGLFLYARARPGKATVPIIYPPESATGTGRVFQTVHTPEEFELLLSSAAASRGTLFATFVRLGERPSNSMATHMWEIVRQVQTPNTCTVCVEVAGGRNDELARRYLVNTVPSVVALKKTLPYDVYQDAAVQNSNTAVDDVDKEKLREWVEHVLSK